MGFSLHRWLKASFFLLVLSLATFVIVCEAEDDEESRRQLHYYLKGRYLFQKQCTTCHGTTGRGNGPWAAELTDKPRNFRTGIFKFRTTPFGKLPTDEDLRRNIRSGISGTAMPFFANLSDDDVTALIAYLKSLSRNWNDEALVAVPLELPPVPDWFRDAGARKAHAEKGAATFATQCSVCHGPDGKGDGPGSQGLVDVWENPIVPADLAREHHKSGDAPTDLYRTIATGLKGTPMVGYAEGLKPDEIWDLVVFIRGLAKEGAEKQASAR